MACHRNASSQPCYRVVTSNMILAFALILSAAAPARAGVQELVLMYGETDGDYRRTGLGLRFGPWWSADWGNWKATLRPELELSHLRYSGPSSGPDSLNQAGGIGLFRVQYGQGRFRPYAEAGLGAGLFSRERLGNKDFSTHFQFSEHLGLGLGFAERVFAGWRFSHFSNANIEKPNDGIDLHQVVIGAFF